MVQVELRSLKSSLKSVQLRTWDYLAILTVSIGVFILKDGASIPLHDHVGMHGVLKVLYGTLNVQSYSPVDLPAQTNSHSMQQSWYIKARRFPVSCISEKDSPAMLSPSDHNLHTIGTVGGSASFLDILAPPYDPDGTCGKIRDCYYYADVGEEEGHVILKSDC
ncbi:2-aminoethanethiol dioxygenase isoform X2 [Daphnia magna]|uniref:2-aminoethanethiol dioxygenase isoform X2 n=1 Tax=Daphnia magna TaxID=35525 RepID=UPI001E1BCA16|nr:2-aminoethanethiol dioxygenase isoform X2 [Daphnia magna]